MVGVVRLLTIVGAAGAAVACAATPWHDDSAVRRGAAIALGTLILWIGEVAPLGVVALAVPIAAVFSGLLRWTEAIAAWGDPVVFLFLGAFLLARALDKHGAFDRVLRMRCPGGDNPGGVIILAILGFSGLISTLQNNTAVTAMLLPITLGLARRTRASAAVMLALAWGATFGGMATPVGTAPNVIGYAAMKRLDAGVSFPSWMKAGVPLRLGATLIGWAVLRGKQDLWMRQKPEVVNALRELAIIRSVESSNRIGGRSPAWK